MKADIPRRIADKRIFFVFVFLFFFFIYKLSSAGDTPYNYFTRLAEAIIHGRLYLTKSEPWLSELIPLNDKFYVPYSPFPAVLALPFVFIFGGNFSQTILTHIIAATIPTTIFLLAQKEKLTKHSTLFLTLLSGVGTIIWFQASVGSSWYLGQITSAALLTLAIALCIRKRSPLLIGLLIGAAYMSRVHTILALPFFIYLQKDILFSKKYIKNWVLLFTGIGLLLLTNALYNYVRFGVVWDKGYLLIPGVLAEPWFSKGIIHYSYIRHNLETLFLSLPIFSSEVPYIKPSWNGLSILITTPVFIYIFKSNFKSISVRFAFLAIFLIGLFVIMHGSNGFSQFGYRFAIDFYPFLFYILFTLFKEKSPSKVAWGLLFIGILVNLWGVLWINVFGWVGF